jgi:hypothetical protein
MTDAPDIASDKPKAFPNVVELRPKDLPITRRDLTPDEWEINQTHNFDRLYGEYLKARSKCVWPSFKEGAIDKACDDLDNAFWNIVSARAYLFRQIEFKFEMLREVIDALFADERHRAMVESIRLDLKMHWQEKRYAPGS